MGNVINHKTSGSTAVTRRDRFVGWFSCFFPSQHHYACCPSLHQWVLKIINFRFRRWKSRHEAVRRWFIRLRQRAGNSVEAKAATIAHDFHSKSVGWAGAGFRKNAVPRHLHSRGTCATHKIDRGKNSSLVQQPTSSSSQAGRHSVVVGIFLDGNEPPGILDVRFRLSNAATARRCITIQLNIFTQ